MKKGTVIIIVLLSLAFVNMTFARHSEYIISTQGLKTLVVNFEKLHKENNSKDVVKGKIYFRKSKVSPILSVHVSNPVNQWLSYEDKEMKIYYPKENKAFLIKSQVPFSLPFFDTFVGVVEDDFGLTKLGYSMSSHEMKGDTLITYWDPPKEHQKIFGIFTLTYVENKITRVEARYADGSLMSKTEYSDHIKFNSYFFPRQIVTKKYYQNGGSSYEKVTYKNVKFNENLPKEVTEFRIPDDAKIKRVEW